MDDSACAGSSSHAQLGPGVGSRCYREARMTRISPWLSVADTATAIGYYLAAYDAEELERVENDEGTVEVAHLAIDGVDFWVQRDPSATPGALDGEAIRMILAVDDPDATSPVPSPRAPRRWPTSTKATAGASAASSTRRATTARSAGRCDHCGAPRRHVDTPQCSC